MKYKLKSLRVGQGIKQRDFAKILGITPQYLGLIEKGAVEPRRNLMMKISKTLDYPVEKIFFNES